MAFHFEQYRFYTDQQTSDRLIHPSCLTVNYHNILSGVLDGYSGYFFGRFAVNFLEYLSGISQ
jgi:hypothetical protein